MLVLMLDKILFIHYILFISYYFVLNDTLNNIMHRILYWWNFIVVYFSLISCLDFCGWYAGLEGCK